MKPFLEKEGSLLSSIYYTHHTFYPMLAQYGCLRYGLGTEREANVATKLRGWCRAGVLWPSIVALDVEPKGFTGPQSEWGGVDSTPGVIVANGKTFTWSRSSRLVVAPGGRSWDGEYRNVKVKQADGSFKDVLQFKVPQYIAVHNAGVLVSEFGLGILPDQSSEVAKALQDRFGVNRHDLLFDAEERKIVKRLVANKRDFEALRWAIQEIGPYLPKHPVRLLAFEAPGGFDLATVTLYHAKGATSSVAAKIGYADGTGVTVSADSLMRGSASAYNREQFAEVDLERRKVRAWCPADENQKASEVVADLPKGKLIYDLEVCFEGGWIDRSPTPVLAVEKPEPVPGPSPSPFPQPKPKKKGKKLNPLVIVGALVVLALLLKLGGC